MKSNGTIQLRERLKRTAKVIGVFAIATAVGVLSGCAEVGSGPDVPAAIEMTALPSPSVVVGDTLRNVAGVVMPIRATVRNVSGDVIADASVRYLYADYARDSSLAVDSITGRVIALRAATGEARLVARVGSVLQIISKLVVTVRPDSMDREGIQAPSVFTTSLPDTGRSGASANRSTELSVIIRNKSATGVTVPVNAWPVAFELISPANASNDTTKSVYLVDDVGRASVIDTTDGSGRAGRRVRVRATQFPAAGVTDTIVVRASASYKGVTLKGAPVRIALPVKRPN